MLWTWQNSDISNNEVYGGNFEKALSSITAKAIVMPARTDLYFPPEDNEIEVSTQYKTNLRHTTHTNKRYLLLNFKVKYMPNAELRCVETVWGHFAGGSVHSQSMCVVSTCNV
jgi:homoserine O-acetyltransferase/O-succinyltransferase